MFERLRSVLVKTQITPVSWLLGISGILMVRFFLEAISSPTASGVVASDASTLVHYYLFFLSFALGALIFFYFALPKWRDVLPQFVLYFFLAVLLAPIFDFLLTSGNGDTMSYIFYAPLDLLKALATFFGPANGITPGIRIEAALIILFSGVLIYKVEKSVLRAIVSATILYVAIFLFVSLPSLIALGQQDVIFFLGTSIGQSATFLNNLHGTLIYGYPARALEIGFNFLLARLWYLISIVLAFLWFFKTQKEKTLAVFKNSRPERVAFHLLAVCLGLALAHIISPPKNLTNNINWADAISLITLLLSFYFSWIFAVSVNDVADEDIDKISNTTRPLIKGALNIEETKQVSYIFLLASLVGGFLAGYYAFFCLLAFTALYYIYSAPPTRFKRIPFFSSLLIGFCVLSEVMAGFFTLSNSKIIAIFPTRAIFAIVLSVFLWAHIRDLKDIEGDSKAGIDTVPVLFNRLWGSDWGVRLVAIFASLAYLLAPFFLNVFLHSQILWLTSIPAAIATYYFCMSASTSSASPASPSTYREFPLFLIYFIFLIISLILLRPIF